MIKFVTYNIDGLPSGIDLKTLPWLLKPLSWVYRLVKGTTMIPVNDNGNRAHNIEVISSMLQKENADIICVQEDFNFHKELMTFLMDYKDSKHTSGIDLKNIRWFPYPRFKADGLNMLTNKRVSIMHSEIVPWKKSYGYFKHANDKLTQKGFRYYVLLIDGIFELDVYVVHMDADFYSETNKIDVRGDIKARGGQLKQIASHIIDGKTGNPIIIIGDTNSHPDYSWDYYNIIENLANPINATRSLAISEPYPERNDVDRIFVINNVTSPYVIRAASCRYAMKYECLSDHYPLITEINYEKR